jgi:predicted  nucleic acid-binding Zn-ribbon protein
MRLNELQNIILRHLRLQVTMHAEFQMVVIGKFRSLRREYMPSSYEMQLSSQPGRGQGVSFLLAQCLAGGVYRWLMLSCGVAIDKAVQMMAHRAHLTVLSRLPVKDRQQISKVPQVGAQHWEAIVAESLKHQQHTRLHLLADCEVLRTSGVGSASANANPHPDTEILAVLQRLEFEAASLHTAAATQERVELEMRSPAYCGLGNYSHSHGGSSSSSSSSSSNNKQGQVHSKPMARSKGSQARVSFADASTAGGDLQALQDEVQSRYLDLLRQVETTGSCGAAASAGVTVRDDEHLSQEQADDSAGDMEEVPPEALRAFLQSAREDLVDLRALLAVEDQCWAIAGPDRKQAHANPLHPNVGPLVSLRDRPEAEREAILGPMPAPLDSSLFMAGGDVEAVTSMKVLKGRVDAALLDLSVRRRGEVLSWEANDALRMGAKAARKAAMDRAEKTLQRLDDLGDRVQRAQGDIAVAARWTAAMLPTITVVEGEKRKVADLQKVLDAALSRKDACMGELSERTGRFASAKDAIARAKQALADTEREVAWELSADDADADEDEDAGTNKETTGLSILGAVNQRASVLKRSVLRQLRSHARHRRKLKAYAAARSTNVALRIGRPAFLAWRRLVDVARSGRRAEKWFNRNVVASRCFRCWKQLADREQLVRAGSRRLLCRKGLRYFHFWRSVARAGRVQALMQRRRRGAALCFLVKRIFRAWRALAATCRSDPIAVAAGIVRATKYWKAKLFTAWATSHRRRCDLILSRGEELMRQRMRDTLHTALTEWWDIKQTEWFRYRTKRVRVFRALSSLAVLRRHLRGGMRVARHRERSGRLRSALRHLHRIAQQSAALRRSLDHACSRRRSRTLRSCWALWQQSWIPRQAAMLAVTRVASSSSSSSSSANRQQDHDQHQISAERAQPTNRSRLQAEAAGPSSGVSVPVPVPVMPESAEAGPEVLSAVQVRWNALQAKSTEWSLSGPDDDDDDDDDDDGYDDSPKRRCLFKALERWQTFKQTRARFRILVLCLREQRDWRLLKSSFSSVAAAWARSSRAKTAAMTPAATDSAVENDALAAGLRDALRADLQAAIEQTAQTASSIDESSAQLLNAIDRCDDLRLQVADLEASASMTRQEHERNLAAIAQLREESQAVYILAQAFGGDRKRAPVPASAGAEAAPSPAALMVTGPSGAGTAVAVRVDEDPPPPELPSAYSAMLEESASLAKNREDNTDRARSARLLAQRQQQQLASQTESASKEAGRLRDLAARLDDETLEVRGRTAAAAAELIRMEHAIRATREKDAAAVRFHEDLAATMESQRRQALAETAQALAEEKELQAELSELHAQIAAQDRAKASSRAAFGPKQLAGVEVAGKELQGRNSAALRSLKSVLVDEKNKATLRLSQAATDAPSDTERDSQRQRESIESLRAILRTSADRDTTAAVTAPATSSVAEKSARTSRRPLAAASPAANQPKPGSRGARNSSSSSSSNSNNNADARLRPTTASAKENVGAANSVAFNTGAHARRVGSRAVVGSSTKRQAKAPRQVGQGDDDNADGDCDEITALSLRIRQRLLGGP